ncbi:MAG: hypothetical protein JRH20_23845 [Deltaproteobacteria bacterium]|nr:hypothetical protein [Deltaproteobacteria bacterium]
MRLGLTLSVALSFGVCITPLSAAPRVEAPPLIVGQPAPASIVIRGIPGSGSLNATSNVGKIRDIVDIVGGATKLTYTPPRRGSPQRLLLLCWRKKGPAHLVQLPLSAWTDVEVKTRRGRSLEVRVRVADHVFGPIMSGRKRKVKIRILVPPGVRSVEAEARRSESLVTRRRVTLPPLGEKLLVAGTRKRGSRKGGDLRYDIFIAASAPMTPQLGLLDPEGKNGEQRLSLTPHGETFSASWAPTSSSPPGRWLVQVRAGEHLVELPLELAPWPSPTTKPTIVRKRTPPPGLWKRLRFSASFTLGLLHNLGELTSPRFALELAAEHPFSLGWLGLRLSTGFAFDSQGVDDGSFNASSSLWMLPVGLSLSYNTRRANGFSGHLLAGGVVQLTHSNSEGPITGTIAFTEVSAGAIALAGVAYAVGPGDILMRFGYQHLRVDRPDLALLAGGMVVAGGYSYVF